MIDYCIALVKMQISKVQTSEDFETVTANIRLDNIMKEKLFLVYEFINNWWNILEKNKKINDILDHIIQIEDGKLIDKTAQEEFYEQSHKLTPALNNISELLPKLVSSYIYWTRYTEIVNIDLKTQQTNLIKQFEDILKLEQSIDLNTTSITIGREYYKLNMYIDQSSEFIKQYGTESQ